MRTQNVFTATLTDQVTSWSGVIKNMSPDALYFYLAKTGGTGPITKAWLDIIKLNIMVKDSKGVDFYCAKNLRLSDAQEISDFEGGTARSDTDTLTCFKIDLGNIILSGEDEMMITLDAKGHPTASTIYTCIVDLFDQVEGPEKPFCYESYIGTGNNISLPETLAAFYHGAAALGNSFSVDDGRNNYNITDTQAVVNANTNGRMETIKNFGLLYVDGFGLGVDLYLNAPNAVQMSRRMLVVKPDRATRKAAEWQQMVADKASKVQSANPARTLGLSSMGLLG